ncbi:MAG: PEP-CTERM sorting domain-containing protein [Opitutae bacterium]|jgi:hypothetical protein|nr:PEP-CTERM sorting domain-containing protein [Opitutae bacterium]
MKKITLLVATFLALVTSLHAATGIFGAYLTVDGTKYKSDDRYGGSEATFNGADFGDMTIGSSSLILSQGETLAYADNGHSTFEFALAYRVRLDTESQSINPDDYTFITMGDGASIGGNDEKAEFTGSTLDFLNGLSAPVSNTIYAIDIVHKAGAWEGGSNFERLANVNSPNPGDTAWGSTDAFTATFTVVAVPEPSSYALIAGLFGLSYIAMRRRKA